MKTYEKFLQGCGEAIVLVDFRGKILFVNEAAKRILGIKASFAEGCDFQSIIESDKHIYLKSIRFVDEAIVFYLTQDIELDKNDFLTINQLRVPLVSMRRSLELLRADDAASADKSVIIEGLNNSNEYAIRLIDDILDFEKLKSDFGDQARIEQSLERLFLEVIELFLPIANHKGQKILFDRKTILGRIRTNPVLFKNALSNIIDNAITYGIDNSEIRIAVRFEIKDGVYVVSVHNNGFVISEAESVNIFEKFYRSDRARVIKPNGIGLGLYAARISVERNGGEIWFESSGLHGTTFYFSIPNLV